MADIKFNGGNPVVLCDDCGVIVKYVGDLSLNKIAEIRNQEIKCAKCAGE